MTASIRHQTLSLGKSRSREIAPKERASKVHAKGAFSMTEDGEKGGGEGAREARNRTKHTRRSNLIARTLEIFDSPLFRST